MGEWIIGALINLCGSVAVNFGTNLLKLGHIEREQLSVFDHDGTGSKPVQKPIIYFQTWRVGILFFALGNCLNFVSFGYAAQSLLAALGSIQFVSNIAFTYFVLNKKVTGKVLIATAVIVFGNVFLVAFGNHQSPVFTPEQLEEKYSNLVFIFYCIVLAFVVAANQYTYRKGETLLSSSGFSIGPYWHMLLPLSYAIVSGAVGSCSVLFAKSLSNLLRLAMGSHYQLHSWFTYSLLLLFLGTAGFWMARLNEGLALFDAILIVPMFQIAWTFFSICTGIVYFQEYQVFDMLRTTMFVLGMVFVFAGISLLAPEDSKGVEAKGTQTSSSPASSTSMSDWSRPEKSQIEGAEVKYGASVLYSLVTRMADVGGKLKTACTVSLGLSEDAISASSVLAMPMVSSRMTGFRGTAVDRAKLFQLQSPNWSLVSSDEDDPSVNETRLLLSQNHV